MAHYPILCMLFAWAWNALLAAAVTPPSSSSATSFSVLLPFYVMARCGRFNPPSLYMDLIWSDRFKSTRATMLYGHYIIEWNSLFRRLYTAFKKQNRSRTHTYSYVPRNKNLPKIRYMRGALKRQHTLRISAKTLNSMKHWKRWPQRWRCPADKRRQ